MNNRTKRLTFIALSASVALVLSYIEALIPPIYAALPAVKVGLPNIVIIFVLYKFGLKDAIAVSVIRLLCVTLLFGNAVMLVYSIAGAALSLSTMALLRYLDRFSTVGVSVCGGVMHNLGQILIAMLLLDTIAVGFYFPVLIITGSTAGIFVGLAGSLLLKKLKNNSLK